MSNQPIDPDMAKPLADAEREIIESYRPYHTLPAFEEGLAAHAQRIYRNPYDGQPQHGVAAQAWDRGLEAAARIKRLALD
jgi:hypothetical protein